jgi:hypothetical protein
MRRIFTEQLLKIDGPVNKSFIPEVMPLLLKLKIGIKIFLLPYA